MNIELLKKCSNIDQIAGIRESKLLRGRGQGTEVAEFYNAAGLRFTVIPDRCMDLYDLSFKGTNLSYHSQNGLISPFAFDPSSYEFADQWPGGMMVTCGLDNVGGGSSEGGNHPTHGRIAHLPASNFGTETYWDGDDYILKATGEVHMTRMFTRHLSIRRTYETSLNAKSVKIHDVITNFDDADEPFQLLYHTNWGYPLLDANSVVATSKCDRSAMNGECKDFAHMMNPVDGRGEDLYFQTNLGKVACGVLYNPDLEIGSYIRWDTANLPNFQEWQNMRSHEYVLAIEPCNTCGMNRDKARAEGKIAILPAYSSIEHTIEIGVLDGMTEINAFVANL